MTKESGDSKGGRAYAWTEIAEKLDVEAAFFSGGVPLIAFSTQDSEGGLRSLKQRLWSYGKVPLLLNVSDEEVLAFSSTAKPEPGQAGEAEEILRGKREAVIAQGLARAFARQEVESGQTRERLQVSGLRVSSALLQNLFLLRRYTDTPPVADRERPPASRTENSIDTVVGGAITASYLQDRGMLSTVDSARLAEPRPIWSVLESGRREATAFFRQLAERFNGDVFGFMPAAIEEVSENDLARVASLLRGDDLSTGQRALWPYDFSVLPADLVSSIYEQLLTASRRADGAYYTPTFLVDLMLDELLPWDGTGAVRLVDIACGSGAFLTEAFRRMAYQERVRLGAKLSYDQLRTLLVENIFGIDINGTAARVAAFGLYLALLEEVDTPSSLLHARLPPLLGSNLIVADAFSDEALPEEKFDIVVTNPPWLSKLTRAAEDFLSSRKRPYADNQMAHAFLWLAYDKLLPGGSAGIVMPAKPMLYNKSRRAEEFRSEVFRAFDVNGIVDLSAMRGGIFPGATMPAAVVMAARPDSEDADNQVRSTSLTHVATHRRVHITPDRLAVTPEEVRDVSISLAMSRPEIWKVLLWGAPRDLDLLDRLRLGFPSLADLVRKGNWRARRGFQIKGGDENSTEDVRGLRVADTENVELLRLVGHLRLFDAQSAHRPRARDTYKSPLLLIRRGIKSQRIAAVLSDEDLSFPDSVIGISAGAADRDQLLMVTAAITSSVGSYWHFLTSSSWGVDRGYVELNEHLTLPIPPSSEAHSRELGDIFAEAKEVGPTDATLERLDEIVFDAYNLSTSDRRRIRERVTLSIGRFYDYASLAAPVTHEGLRQYSDTIANALNTTIDGLSVRASDYSFGRYRVVVLNFGEPTGQAEPDQEVEVDVDTLLQGALRPSVDHTGFAAQPGGLYADGDTIYIVKTSNSDRWTYDASLDDADRIVGSLLMAD